ncbi:MAG: acyltransferase family protein [Acidimicrobiia bacterium]
MGANSRLGYRPGLDGLRAIAVLTVVLFHYGAPVRGGWLGVNLFFVISGFLITRLLLDEHEHDGRIDLRAFYQRRAARLLPLMYGAVALFLAVGFVVPAADRGADVRGAVAGLLYVANLDRYLGWSSGGMFGHLWSLSLEEQFYACWPLALLWLLGRGHRARLARIATAVSLAVFTLVAVRTLVAFDVDAIYNGIEGQGSGFLFAGCAMGAATGRRIPSGPAVAGGAAVISAGFLLADYTAPATYLLLPLVVVAMVPVIDAAAADGRIARVLGCSVLRHVGRLSYGIYLIHSNVRILLIRATGGAGPALSVVAFVLTLALAEVSFRYLEQPLRRRLSPNRPRPGGRADVGESQPAMAGGG